LVETLGLQTFINIVRDRELGEAYYFTLPSHKLFLQSRKPFWAYVLVGYTGAATGCAVKNIFGEKAVSNNA
jgi:hypothetical protein